MQISGINSTQTFKPNFQRTPIDVEDYELVEKSYPPEKKDDVDLLNKGINTAVAGSLAFATSKPISERITNGIEKGICKFTKDFADDKAKLALEQMKENGEKGLKATIKKITKFNTNPIDSLPQRGKAAIAYTVLAALTSLFTYIAVKDVDKDGQSDSLEAIKKLLNPV